MICDSYAFYSCMAVARAWLWVWLSLVSACLRSASALWWASGALTAVHVACAVGEGFQRVYN